VQFAVAAVLKLEKNKAVNRGVNHGWFSLRSNRQVLEKLGGVRSHMRTGLHRKFPVIREFNREFGEFGAFWNKKRSDNAGAAAVSRRIP
jgi:hypothetical protein